MLEELVTAIPILDREAIERERPRSRLIVRIVGEMQASVITAIQDFMSARCGATVPIERIVLFLMVLRASARFQQAALGHVEQGQCCHEGISINAMATSINRPFETIRRHVIALVACGLLDRRPDGIVIPEKLRTEQDFAALLAQLHDEMTSLIENLVAFDVPMPAPRTDRTYKPDATIAAAMDIVLGPFEYAGPMYGSWLEMCVVSAVIIANARPFTFDQTLSRAYSEASTVPPDDWRVPVRASAVARAMRHSYTTVRRAAMAAVADGRLEQVAGGLRARQDFLRHEIIAHAGQIAAARAAQVFNRMAPSGFRFDNPAACYITGKPALLSFD